MKEDILNSLVETINETINGKKKGIDYAYILNSDNKEKVASNVKN